MIDYKIGYLIEGEEIVEVTKEVTNRLSCYPLHNNPTG